MTPIIIPFRHSELDDVELRFCLRSIERLDTEVVIVTDDAPSWLQNVKVLKHGDNANNLRDENIMRKVLFAAEQISSTSFIWSCDDYLLLSGDADFRPCASNTSGWSEAVWKEKIALTSWWQAVRNAQVVTGTQYNYDTHHMCMMSRDRFISVVRDYLYRRPRNIDAGYGVSINTYYYGKAKVRPVSCYRLHRGNGTPAPNKWYWNINKDTDYEAMLPVLLTMFPKRSKYELTDI